MTIKQIQLANTFDVWRITTNDLITVANDLVEGNLQTTGTVALTNPSGFQNNVSLNVQSGMIYGDGGLLSNVGKPGSIVNNKLQNTTITVTSTSEQVLLSTSTLTLGSSAYLNVTNLITSVNDTSTANIPSANVVNVSHRIATFANVAVAAAFTRTNAVSDSVNSSYVLANTMNSQLTAIISDLANNAISDGAAFNTANLAFGRANVAVDNVNYVNTATVAAFATANIALANVTFANSVARLAFDGANAGFGAANAAFGRANIAVANVNYVNTFAQLAFDKANAALPNVGGQSGVTLTGNLRVTGVYADQYGNVRLQYSSTPADTSRLLTKNDIANLVVMGTNTSATQSNTYVPENTFTAGDVIRLYNPTSSAQTVVSNAMFVRIILSGSATANSSAGAWRNVSANAVVTLYCINNNTFVLDGPGAQE